MLVDFMRNLSCFLEIFLRGTQASNVDLSVYLLHIPR